MIQTQFENVPPRQIVPKRFFAEKYVDAFHTEVSKPPDNSKQLLYRIFGKKIEQWPEEDQGSRSILESLYSQSLDDGVIEKRTFIDKKGVVHTEKGHSILNRKAMLSELKERTNIKFNNEKQEYEYDKNFKILTLDLKGFREADENGAGDYDLNIVTRQLNLAMESISKDLGVRQEDLILGRYGGDEFYVVAIENKLSGSVDPLVKIREIKEIIKKKVESEKGFFEKPEAENFKIKDGEVKEINIDKMDLVNRTIFLNSLNSGLVLDEIELKQEREYVKLNVDGLDQQEINKAKKQELLDFIALGDQNIYSKEIDQIEDPKVKIIKKIEFLIAGHSELELPFFLAKDLDSQTGKTEVMEQLLNFYENYLIDPLLNEITMSRADIFNHIGRGEFSNIYEYEVKMKEINDNMSYVYGDKTIKQLWNNKFKVNLRQAIKDGKVKVGRIGGIIVICETKDGGGLDDKTKELLKDPGTVKTEFNGEQVDHEVGFAKIEIPTDVSNAESPSFAMTIEKMFVEPTRDWIRKTLRRIVGDEKEFAAFIKTLKRKVVAGNKLTTISAKYFNSARAKKRIPLAHEILKEIRGLNSEKVEEIYTLLTLIKDGYGWVWVTQQTTT